MTEPESPCTGVCRLDAAGTCIGCGRRIEEIAEWPTAEPERRRAIAAAARERLSILRRKPDPSGTP